MAIGDIRPGAAVQLAVRPERIAGSSEPADNRFRATVDGRIYHGDHQRLLARLSGGQVLTIKIGPDAAMAAGETIDLGWRTADCRAFPAGVAADSNAANTGSVS